MTVTSQKIGTKNVKYGGIFKASKKPANHTYFKDCASQNFFFKIGFELVSMTFVLSVNASLVKKVI